MPSREHGCGCRADFTIAGAKPHYAPDLVLQPFHLDVSLRFSIEERKAWGKVIQQIRSNRDNARTLVLNALNFLDVVVTSNDTHHLSYRYDGKEIVITWSIPIKRGEVRSVAIEYAVSNPVSGMHFRFPDKSYPEQPLMVYSDDETERTRYWLPCVDFPAVRTTVEFHLTHPIELAAVANGVLMSDEKTEDGKSAVATWKLDYPCPSYLLCFGVGDLNILQDGTAGVDRLPVAYVASKKYGEANVRRAFGETPGMINWIEKRVGQTFPFPKYYTMLLPEMAGAAMENISLVTFADTFLMDEISGQEYQHYVDLVVIHEMAHSYFGDAVVIRHFEHAWLKESWATYIEACWLQDNRGADEYMYELYLCAASYFSEAEDYVRPIVTREYNHSWTMYDMHLYPGGAWRLHMLRNIIGEETFWAGVKEYLSMYTKKTVETDDFRKCLEAESGLNLTQFFDQWIFSKGYPQLKGTFEYDQEHNSATITLQQTQENTARGVGLFDFEIEIELDEEITPGGVTFKHLAKVRFSSEGRVSARAVHVFQGLKGKPAQVIIDPHSKVLFKLDFNPGQDLLTRTLTEAPSVIHRIWAASELVKIGSTAALQKVQEGMKKEPFFGVRVEVAKQLVKNATGAVIGLLVEMLLQETHPRGLYPIAGLVGQIRDPQIRQALLSVLARTNIAYTARARALESLGSQRGASEDPAEVEANIDSDFQLLRKAADDMGFQATVRKGALKGLAALRTHAAYEFLKTRVPYGKEHREARGVAIMALASCASWQDKKIQDETAETVVELLRDDSDQIRMTAINALVELKATSKSGAVRSTKKTLAEQKHPWADRRIMALESSGDATTSQKLQKDVEDLQSKVRRLEEKLQDALAKLPTPHVSVPAIITPAPDAPSSSQSS
eukprot:CAMPEP_0184647398 /NCGR_PEP_ID=MMETSP0308-20130426/4314_1 /TAXON_ID=38269 /ORGANISM="Gloeochaete witrockiana, Strain SAG 46.84" /LENGTH=897 /DNA_ID=CAMNT_0027078317 /DNA_START=88 /DNA_END=2781 /DNA_ORIENTATION=-